MNRNGYELEMEAGMEAERLAAMWRALYEALKAQRFTTVETLQLMSAYLNGGARR